MAKPTPAIEAVLNAALQAALVPRKLDELFAAVDENFDGGIRKGTFIVDVTSVALWEWVVDPHSSDTYVGELKPAVYEGTIRAEGRVANGQVVELWIGDQ